MRRGRLLFSFERPCDRRSIASAAGASPKVFLRTAGGLLPPRAGANLPAAVQASRAPPVPDDGFAGRGVPPERPWPIPPSASRVCHDPALEPVREKVLGGRRLGFEDGVALYRTHDLLGLGALANHVREEKHGDAAYFVWNTHVNHTNVCVATCDFCAFAAKKRRGACVHDVGRRRRARAWRRSRRAFARCTSWAACTRTCRSRTSRTC